MKQHLLKTSLVALSLSCFSNFALASLAEDLTTTGGTITSYLTAVHERFAPETDDVRPDLVTALNTVAVTQLAVTTGTGGQEHIKAALDHIKTTYADGEETDGILTTVETALKLDGTNLSTTYSTLDDLKTGINAALTTIGTTPLTLTTDTNAILAKISDPAPANLNNLSTWFGNSGTTGYTTVKGMVDDFNATYTVIGGTDTIDTNISNAKTEIGSTGTLKAQIESITAQVDAADGANMMADLYSIGNLIKGDTYSDTDGSLINLFNTNLSSTEHPTAFESVQDMKNYLDGLNVFTIDTAIDALLGVGAHSDVRYTGIADESARFSEAATVYLTNELMGISYQLATDFTQPNTNTAVTNLVDAFTELNKLIGSPIDTNGDPVLEGEKGLYARLLLLCNAIGGTGTLSERITALVNRTVPRPPEV
ncbi:MAG: hypothetical protein ACK5PQ_04175 [Alphaproteobacteria bacterium]